MKSLAETMGSITKGGSNRATLDLPQNADLADEIRRYVALCAFGRWVWNLSMLTQKFVAEARGVKLSPSTVREWIMRDELAGPLLEVCKGNAQLASAPKKAQAYVVESVKWLDGQK